MIRLALVVIPPLSAVAGPHNYINQVLDEDVKMHILVYLNIDVIHRLSCSQCLCLSYLGIKPKKLIKRQQRVWTIYITVRC